MRYVTSVIEAVWGVTLPVEQLCAVYGKGAWGDLIALFARTRSWIAAVSLAGALRSTILA